MGHMEKLTHDVVCPQGDDEFGCPCARWIGLGNPEFSPPRDCDRCNCDCEVIAKAREDEREKWLDFSGHPWGSHEQSCEWWGKDSLYMHYCEDTYAATWIECRCRV